MALADKYTEANFWRKLGHYALKAGLGVVERALYLYYAAQRPETPAWAKTIIYGALAYFIMPIDVIPDFIPIVGYSDDLGALAAALGLVSLYINDEVKQRARQTLQRWFGPGQG